jgi:hypothetical protein
MTLLTNEEKIGIANQHLKNLQYNRYNLELSLKEENALDTPNAASVADVQSQLNSIDAKIEVIEAEIDTLS